MKRSLHCVMLAVAVAATVVPVAFALGVTPDALIAAGPTLFLAGAAFGRTDLIKSKQLREQRASLVEENRKVLDKVEAEKDQARVKELEEQWDKRDAEIVKLSKDIERAERQEALEAAGDEPANPERRSGRVIGERNDPRSPEERNAAYRAALFGYLRYGMENLEPEARQVLRGGYASVAGERRDGLSSTNAAGGYTIPTDLFRELQQSMLAYGGARTLAFVLTTDSGNPINVPTVDDTGNKAAIVTEGSSLTSPVDTSFGVVALTSFMYRSFLPVTLELLQDSAFNIEEWIKGAMAVRLARGTNVHFTTGNGTTQPGGFIPGGSSGYTAASATAVAFNDLVELEHSVDPAYRTGPSVGWQFKDSTLKVIKKLVDTQNRPLWLPGLAVKEPDTILGYKYVINQDMAAVQASNKSIAFGDWSKFWIRDVRGMMIVRANELHIQTGQVGFYLFSRHDSAVMDAGTDPLKHLTHPSPD